MHFTMEIDNPRKRCRDEPSFGDDEGRIAKKARQFNAFASARDSDSTPSSPNGSALSSPAAMEEDTDPFQARAAQWQQTPEPQPQTQSRGTIISAWNQARRAEEYMRQYYPWLLPTHMQQ